MEAYLKIFALKLGTSIFQRKVLYFFTKLFKSVKIVILFVILSKNGMHLSALFNLYFLL